MWRHCKTVVSANTRQITYVLNCVRSRVLDFYERRWGGKKSNFKCLDVNECRIVMVQIAGKNNNNNNNKNDADYSKDVAIQNEVWIRVACFDVEFLFSIRFFTNSIENVDNSRAHTHITDTFSLSMTDNESADTGINERFCVLPLFLFIG